MAAYFNLNNNEISKKILVNKFNILDNQGRVMVNDKKNPFAKWTKWSWFVPKQPPEVFCKKVFLKSSQIS